MSKKYDEIENMMLDIVDFGKEITYNEIEEIIEPPLNDLIKDILSF